MWQSVQKIEKILKLTVEITMGNIGNAAKL
jgi:hypothetical protein